MSDAPSNGHLRISDAIGIARELLPQLVGKQAEAVSGANRTDDGWTITLDVVELSRIPPSTDLMASYDVSIDSGGDLVDLVRTRRYMRNQADEE